MAGESNEELESDDGLPVGRPPIGVDVVIINWNTAHRALETAAGFAASSDVDTKIFIVDNDSLPEQQALLRSAGEDLFELIESPGNAGFGRAANLGASYGSNPYLAVCNADLLPQRDTLAELVRVCDQSADAGMVGPVFTNGGNHYHDHLPGPLTLLARSIVGGFGRKPIHPPDPGQIARVEQPSGACFLISRATWNTCGGFDDRFFLWYEDVDLAHRLRDAGKTGLIVGSARVEHIGGESFDRLEPVEKQNLRLTSLYLYIRAHHPITAIFARPLISITRRLRAYRLKR